MLASFNGHEHWDYDVKYDDIWYINSISCLWIDEDFVVENVYGKEIDKKYPNIKYVVPYKDPNFAIITVGEDGLDIKGTLNKYYGPSPGEIVLYKKPCSWWFENNYCNRPKHAPDVADRFLPFLKK